MYKLFDLLFATPAYKKWALDIQAFCNWFVVNGLFPVCRKRIESLTKNLIFYKLLLDSF